MSLPIIIRLEAEEDIESAYDWYERQQPRLGRRFLDQLTAAFNRITGGPGMYDLIYEDVRSCRLRRFPYPIYFRTQPEHLEVLAVLHGSRHPETWQDRT